MSIPMVLLPVFVLIGLTFALLLLGRTGGRGDARRGAAAGEVFGDHLPLLFYILIALAMPIRHADLIIVALSWVFVVTRFAYAGLPATASDGRGPGAAWFASAIVLFAMWLYFAVKILLLL
jgi:hypothetical protein